MRGLAAVLSAVTAGLTVGLITGVVPMSLGRRSAVRTESDVEATIRRSGITISVGRLRAASVACAALTYFVVVGVSGIAMVAAVPTVIASLAPRWWVARHAARRQEAVQRAWPDAIRDVVASIGAGISLQHALEALADTGPEPLRPVFTRFAMTARAVGVPAGLEAIRDELADATSDRIVEVLLVAYERGGTIVPAILRDLAAATTRDIWVLEQAQTESLEQRINARAVFLLPWIVLVAITLQEGPFRDFYRSPAGVAVITVGGVASLGGMWMIRRLGSQTPEPRVMA